MKPSDYTVDYFLTKFEAIPAAKWICGGSNHDGFGCALTHCGGDEWTYINNERLALIQLFGGKDAEDFEAVTDVNDAGRPQDYSGRFSAALAFAHPRDRILAALRQIKSEGKEAEPA